METVGKVNYANMFQNNPTDEVDTLDSEVVEYVEMDVETDDPELEECTFVDEMAEVAIETKPDIKVETIKVRVTNCKSLNVRSLPSDTADKVCMVKTGATFHVEKYGDSEWAHIVNVESESSVEGYVVTHFITEV